MLNRFLVSMLSVAAVAGVLHAEPIPWTYSVWMKPAGGADGIRLSQEIRWESDDDAGRIYHVLSNIGPDGYLSFGYEMPTERIGLFRFGQGDWQTTLDLDEGKTYVDSRFRLQFLVASNLGGNASQSVSGSVEGSIYASGVFTSGTGNLSIGFIDSGEFDLNLNGRKAKLQFTVSNNETHTAIHMQVTPVAVETPEPGTLALAGMGIAGVLGYRVRGLRKRNAVV